MVIPKIECLDLFRPGQCHLQRSQAVELSPYAAHVHHFRCCGAPFVVAATANHQPLMCDFGLNGPYGWPRAMANGIAKPPVDPLG